MKSDSQIAPFEGQVAGELDTASLFAKVLLVEDEASHATLIKRALRNVVGEVVHAETGQAAIDQLTTSLPELVLCDLRLPDTTGLRVLETIRAARPGLPTIVMTASSELDDAVSVMRAGAWDYMVKDFNESFTERVRLVVTRCAHRKLQQMRELQVRAERDAFAAAVRSSPDGSAVIDRDGAVVFANDSFRELYMRLVPSHEAGAPANIVEALRELNSDVAQQVRSVLETESGDSVMRLEICVESSDESGVPHYFELVFNSAFVGERSEETSLDIRRSILWSRDITAKKAQEKFQRDILSTTSHDLKGPLGAILTSVELLSESEHIVDTRAQDLITRVGSCARNCVTLIDELLSARRIQDGVLVVRPVWIAVSEVVEDVVLDYASMARDKKINLVHDAIPDLLDMYADKIAIRRVVSNLVSNAIKYTPRGGEVKISAQRVDDVVQISVSDNGSGIEAEARPHLFDRYTRLDKHTGVEGSGLGLFVAKSIVDAHNGHIDLWSEVGVGTSFTVFFPDGPGKRSETPSDP